MIYQVWLCCKGRFISWDCNTLQEADDIANTILKGKCRAGKFTIEIKFIESEDENGRERHNQQDGRG